MADHRLGGTQTTDLTILVSWPIIYFRLVINMLNVEDLPFHSGGTQSSQFPGSIEDGLTLELTFAWALGKVHIFIIYVRLVRKNLGVTDTLPDQRSSSFHLPEEGGKEFLLFVKNPENRPTHNFLPHVHTDICEYLCMF